MKFMRYVLRRGGATVAMAMATACSLDDRALTIVGAGEMSADAGVGADGQSAAPGGSSNDASETSAARGCATRLAARALITDFSDAVPITDSEGNPGLGFGVQDVIGGGESFIYSSFGLSPPSVSLATGAGNRALHFTAMPGIPVSPNYALLGFGLGWGAVERECLDASGYHGAMFKIAGSAGTCQLSFGVQISQDTMAELNAAGTCELESRCYSPQSGPLEVSAGTVSIAFADMIGGSPLADVDPMSIIGVKWQLAAPIQGPPCEADLVVDDIGFF